VQDIIIPSAVNVKRRLGEKDREAHLSFVELCFWHDGLLGPIIKTRNYQ